MAEYKFKASRAGEPGSDVVTHVSRFGRAAFGDWGGNIFYRETATGVLRITDLSTSEKDAIRLAMAFLDREIAFDGDRVREVPLGHPRYFRGHKLPELNKGRLVTEASLYRYGEFVLNRDRRIRDRNPQLSVPVIRSYAGNMLQLQAAMQREADRDARAGVESGPEVMEVMATAERMHEGILRAVEPGLLAVHKFSMTNLGGRL